jgi:hypothetical protein
LICHIYTLKWVSHTYGFKAHVETDKLPEYISKALENNDSEVHVLPLPEGKGYDTNEISHVVVFSEDKLEYMVFKGIEIGNEQCALEKHHGVVALYVGEKYDEKKHKGMSSHLTRFSFD